MENYLGKHITWIWKKKIKPFEMDYSWFYITINLCHALIIGFPGDWPAGHTRKNPRTVREFWKTFALKGKDTWLVFDQTPEMHLRDLFAIGQRYVAFKVRDEHECEPPCRHLYDISYRSSVFVVCLFFIMPLHKAWDVVRGKRKSVINQSIY